MSTSPPPPPVRHITTHSSTGKAIFENNSTTPPTLPIQDGAALFHLAYAADNSPNGRPIISDTDDLQQYKEYSLSPPGVVNPKGTVLRFVDMAPGNASPLHRTVSLDYAVIIFGEVELSLDSGEKRTMGPGEAVVQRATAHAWRNTSETEWARMLFCMIPSEKVVVGGRELGEWMDGDEDTRLS